MDVELFNQLKRNLVAFESAGMVEDVKQVKARIAELEKAPAPKAEASKGAANVTTLSTTTTATFEPVAKKAAKTTAKKASKK